MRAIYRCDGTIKLCGDYPENISAEITQDQADNKELYRVNPNTKEVYLVPTCAVKYRKVVDNVILEMTAEEKAGEIAAYDASVAKALAEAEKAAAETALREIDLKSIRSMREWIAQQETAPQYIKDFEVQAVAARATLVAVKE